MVMADIGGPELIIVALVVLVLFGASKLPKFAKSLGQAKNEFEKGVKEGTSDDKTKETTDGND